MPTHNLNYQWLLQAMQATTTLLATTVTQACPEIPQHPPHINKATSE